MKIKQKLTDYLNKRKVIEIPHERKTLEVVPFFGGLGNQRKYIEVEDNRIKESNLEILSSNEIASVMSEGLILKKMWGREKKEIGYKINGSICDIFEPTINFYLPKSNEEINNGVIIDLRPSFNFKKIGESSLSYLTDMLVNERKSGLMFDIYTNLKPKENLEAISKSIYKNFLISKLRENDPNFKFVPFGYKIGTMATEDIGKNQYLTARYGEEGVNKIERVISESVNGRPPSLISFDHIDEEKITLSAISRWSLPMAGGVLEIRADLNPGREHLYKIYYTKIIE